jgi:uncharacterized integral membrane protein
MSLERAFLSKETTMRFRTLFLFLLLVATGLFALLNWPAFTTNTTLSLGFGTIEAPIGLLMLGVVFLLGAMCLAQIIYVQGSALVDARRQSKELQVQRELADTAEASRFTELRGFVDAEMMKAARAANDLKSALLTRLDQMEQRSHVQLQETANTLYSHLGQLEERIDHATVPAGMPPPERTLPPQGNGRPR